MRKVSTELYTHSDAANLGLVQAGAEIRRGTWLLASTGESFKVSRMRWRERR